MEKLTAKGAKRKFIMSGRCVIFASSSALERDIDYSTDKMLSHIKWSRNNRGLYCVEACVARYKHADVIETFGDQYFS